MYKKDHLCKVYAKPQIQSGNAIKNYMCVCLCVCPCVYVSANKDFLILFMLMEKNNC